MRTTPLLPLVVAAAGSLLVSCGELPNDAALPPAGVISGTLTYTGPKPCTENGRVVGSANLLLFDVRNLPPPDGLATRSVRIAVIPGSALFADIAPSLTYNADDSLWCPSANERVTVSAPFTFAAVGGGRYQVRGFYDLVGDFNPAFKITTASAKGNISGGALLNATEAAAGANPVFAEVTVGAEQADGSFLVPETGVHLRNVAVTFGKPMAFERPYFHVSKAYYPVTTTDASEQPRVEETPKVVEVPADWHIAYGPSEISSISNALLRLEFASTLPAADLAIANAAPYRFRVDTGSTFDVYWDGTARVPGTKSAILADGLPAYGPSVVVSKLDIADPRRLTGQANPRVVSSAIVAREPSLTSLLGATPGTQASGTVIAMLRPTLICITDPNKNGPAHIITPFKQSLSDKPVVADEAGLTADVAALLRRDPAKTTFGEGCLLPGDYAVNVVYPTSQSWTLPNESGTCFGNEQPTASGGCGTREVQRSILATQSFVIRVGKASNPAACRAKVDATMKASCLTPTEIAKLEAGTLFE
jgi:hypothetical protein